MIRLSYFFFFNDTATTEIYTLSLHDALPIFEIRRSGAVVGELAVPGAEDGVGDGGMEERERPGGADRVGPCLLELVQERSEEHTSELQSRQYLVCRLLLEKKKQEHEHSTLLY